MASFKVMPTSSTPPQSNLNSDLSSLQFHHHNLHRSFSSSSPSMMISPPHQQPTPLLDTAEITLIDAAGAISAVGCDGGGSEEPLIRKRTVDDVWRDIMLTKGERKECKVETPDELITLEDFLAKTGAGIDGGDDEDDGDNEDVKGEYDHHQVSYSGLNVVDCGGGEVVGGRRKRRGGSIFEPLDKAAQQRQRRMIKNRESAARSRERKQAYQVELESLAAKLQEENAQLQREKVERAKERYRQIIEKVIPVVEKRRPPRALRRVQST